MAQFNYALFSEKLRHKQYQERLNVTTAAKQIGVTKATLSRFNRQVGTPDVISYFLCCKWVDIATAFFFK